tara:strand:+ start:309 stop:548 length:240 start_codon:yes stop_codon:yes gene_type:complete
MPNDPTTVLTIAGFTFAALLTLSLIGLRGWRDWLQLKRDELEAIRPEGLDSRAGGSRIEVADLKERIRKLEAIASGIEL